jgi:hypothetical protein
VKRTFTAALACLVIAGSLAAAGGATVRPIRVLHPGQTVTLRAPTARPGALVGCLIGLKVYTVRVPSIDTTAGKDLLTPVPHSISAKWLSARRLLVTCR